MNKKDFEESYNKTVKTAVRLSALVQREGVLSLENEIYDLDEQVFRRGLELVLNGADTQVIDRFLSHLVTQEKDENYRIIKTIQKDAALMIQAGTDTVMVYFILSEYTNIKLNDETIEYIEDVIEKSKINDEREQTSEEYVEAFYLIKALDTKSLYKVVREIESMELAKALKNEDEQTIELLLKNLPKRFAGMLEEDLEYTGEVTEEESNICKDKISYIIKNLKEAGEI